jgi:hypothetical protein
MERDKNCRHYRGNVRMVRGKTVLRGMTVMLVLVLLIAGAHGCGPLGPLTRLATEVLPWMDLKAGDRILAMDLDVDPGRAAYIVWSEARESHTSGSNAPKVRVRSKDLRTGRWNESVVLPAEGKGPLRLVSDGRALHVFEGTHLRHLISTDGGGHWAEVDSLVRPKTFTWDWDAIQAGGKPLVTWIERRRPGRPGLDESDTLWIVARKPDQAPAEVDTVVSDYLGKPVLKLLSAGDTVFLFLGLTQNVQRPGAVRDSIMRHRKQEMEHSLEALGVVQPVSSDSIHTFRPGVRLFMSKSGDRGMTWSPMAEIKGLPDWGAADGSIESLAALREGGRLTVYFIGNRIWAIDSKADGTWSKPTAVCPAPPGGLFHPYSEPASIAAVTSGITSRVFWIDTRFAFRVQPDIALFEGPNWANNDVLTLAGNERQSSRMGRLTKSLSYAEGLRVRADGTKAYAAWFGQALVGKRRETFGSPPRLFFATVPLD